MSPRMVVWLSSGAMIAASPTAFPQEYRPVVEERVDGGAVYPAVVEDVSERTSGWKLGAVISAAYDDNIFLSSRAPEADTVFRAAPQLAYHRGDPDQGEGWHASLGYRPTAVVYAENSSENRFDHEAVALIGWRGKVTRVGYTGAFRKLGDATAETGRPTDRIAFSNEVRAAWNAREKITLEAAAGSRGSDYEDPTYFDSRKDYGEVALRYTYSPKTELGLIYQAGRYQVDGSGSQDTQQVGGSIVWQPRSKIRIDLQGGVEHRKTDAGTSLNPVLEGRVDWTPRQGTNVFLNAYVRDEASAFYSGQNYSLRGTSAGLTQRLGGDWSAGLAGGFESYQYERVSGSGAAGREDRLWFIRPELIYRINEKSDLSLFYRISENDSNDPAFGYEQQILGIELNHTF